VITLAISKLESFLETKIEGFFNKQFSGTLEPIEIIKALEREVEKKARKISGEVVAPNRYEIFLGVDDYQRLCAKRVRDTFYTAVAKQAIRKSCFIDGDLRIVLRKDAEALSDTFVLTSAFSDGSESAPPKSEPDTLVLSRQKFDVPLNLPTEYKTVSLSVNKGADVGAYLEFGEKQVYIGRREKSDFILTDESVSRLHAYITFDRYRHTLHDAGSKNGTFVNGEQIESCLLEAGDEIRVGTTIIVYDVI